MAEAHDERSTVVRRARERIEAVRQASLARVQDALSVVPALDLGWELGRRYRRLNGSVLAGHLTYRFFLWLAPLFLLLIASVLTLFVVGQPVQTLLGAAVAALGLPVSFLVLRPGDRTFR